MTDPPPGHPDHVHRLGRDGFYACGCPDPHLSRDPDYDSSRASLVDDDDMRDFDTVHDWFDLEGR